MTLSRTGRLGTAYLFTYTILPVGGWSSEPTPFYKEVDSLPSGLRLLN